MLAATKTATMPRRPMQAQSSTTASARRPVRSSARPGEAIATVYLAAARAVATPQLLLAHAAGPQPLLNSSTRCSAAPPGQRPLTGCKHVEPARSSARRPSNPLRQRQQRQPSPRRETAFETTAYGSPYQTRPTLACASLPCPSTTVEPRYTGSAQQSATSRERAPVLSLAASNNSRRQNRPQCQIHSQFPADFRRPPPRL